jgi:uncharacterized protein YlxP (DUF503 family)
MIVGVMTAHLSLHGAPILQKDGKMGTGTHGVTSLKGKRSIVKSLIGRLRSRFNISISEVDHQDSKNTAVVGIAIVSNEARFIDQQFDSILDFMRNDGRFYLARVERETF